MPRLFVALAVPKDVRAALAALRDDLPGVRWTPPAQYHCTLRFLGNVAPERIEPITEALAEIEAPPVPVEAIGLDVWPSRRRPRVLTATIRPAASLLDIQAQVEAAAQACGFATERRPFRPHVTLARLKDPPLRAVRAYLHAHADTRFAFTAEAFHLYESTLTPDGAVHERRVSFPLKPP